MTEYMPVVIEQVMIFAIIMSVGFIAAKAQVLTKEALGTLSVVIVKIILPAMIFSIIADSGVTMNDFYGSGKIVVAIFSSYILLFGVGTLISKLCRLSGETARILIALTMFGNMGYMGIPLIQAVFDDPSAQVFISMYALIDMALLWTVGITLCSRYQRGGFSLRNLNRMVNPTTVALFLAFVVMGLNLPVPELLMRTVTDIGGTTKYIALIYLGGSLCFVPVGGVVKKPSIFALVLGKMLIMPVVSYLLFGNFLGTVPNTVLALVVGLPTMTTIAMIARAYGSEADFATEVIFVSTLCSLLTLPAISIIISILN